MPDRAFRYRESEARAERREKRQRHEARVTPLANRPTAKALPEDKQIDLSNEWVHRPNDYPVAAISAERYKSGIEIQGHATVEQLVELRDALNSHISEILEEHDE